MAMTLRLDEEESEALRRRADLEGRSMQEVARQALREYIEQTSKPLVMAVAAGELDDVHTIGDRLAETEPWR